MKITTRTIANRANDKLRRSFVDMVSFNSRILYNFLEYFSAEVLVEILGTSSLSLSKLVDFASFLLLREK